MSQSKAELVAPVGIFTASGINVTGVVTAVSFEGDGSQLQGVGIGTTGSINSSGIITASAFYGSGIGLTGITLLGPTNSYETTGIITASAFYGDGIGITNIGGPLSPISYSPGIGQTNVGLSTNIVITFNKPIASAAAASGIATITLRTDAADGTIVESFDIADSAQLSISGGVLTITPSAAMAGLTTHFLVIPAGTLQDTIDTSDNIGITTYSFTTQQLNYELWTWGLNEHGQLGQNNRTYRSSPIQIPGTEWDKIDSGWIESFATKTDGTLWSWGGNFYGQLGQNNKIYYSSPTQVPGTQWSYFGARANAILATKTDGTLWSWGINQLGSLGLNDATQYSSPVQIPGTQWKVSDRYQVSAGDYQSPVSGAIKTDGTLWSWGYGAAGSLAQNNITNYSSPIQIPGTQWNTVSSGIVFIATKTDGTLWAWGGDSQGGLGQNNTTAYSSPRQIPGTQWNVALQNIYGVLATKTDGTLWSWGRNNVGQLGQNNTTFYSSPTQIPGTQWNAISMGYYNGTSIKTNGEFWNWGDSIHGQLGQNSRTQYSSPVQVPGTQWYKLPETGTVYVGMAIKQVAP